MRKTHGSGKRWPDTWGKKLKTTHHSCKQTIAQTISDHNPLWNIPAFVTPSPILLPSMPIMVQKSSFLFCQLPWLCPCLNFYPSLNEQLQGMESTEGISLKFCYLKHHLRQSLHFQLEVNFE